MTTWFGFLETESGEVALADDAIHTVDALEALYSEGETTAPDMPDRQPDLRDLALESSLFRDDAEYNKALREVAILLVRRKLRAGADAEADLLQTIEALDDLNEVVNRLDERLYEWSRLHTEARLRGRKLAELLQGEDLLGDMARADLELRELRQSVERSLETAVSQMAPNLSNLAGPLLAARLISRGGGLKRLSKMPASAIQVMGAEKALFKHLKGKAPSPKHGIIYRHPSVLGSPKNVRGRAARALASKLAIAARIDLYSGELNPELKASLNERLEEIKRARRGKRREAGS
jgi:nucleolar protein 56